MKDRLLNQAIFSLRHRRRLDGLRSSLQGLIVLVGPTGTGKSTAARGLVGAAARSLSGIGATTFVELDPHVLPSEMLGESQRNVAKLLESSLPELAQRRPFSAVLIDEVESFAPRRSLASFETNPADLHRATDAALTGLDRLAEECPATLFIATTNFPHAVDEALLSRADLVENFGLPDRRARAWIIRDSLDILAEKWDSLTSLAKDDGLIDELASLCDGTDGRSIRKLVTSSVTRRESVAWEPGALTSDDLLAVFRDACARPRARQRDLGEVKRSIG